jgi:hypothetical protein
MTITTTKTSAGKYVGTVREGERTLHTTPEYITEAMALADAACWGAFNTTIDPMLEAARQAGLLMAAKMDAENTVTVSSGTHILGWEMAYELRKPAPHPRRTFGGEYGSQMRARQQLFIDVADHLNITYAEAQTLPRMLRASQR